MLLFSVEVLRTRRGDDYLFLWLLATLNESNMNKKQYQ